MVESVSASTIIIFLVLFVTLGNYSLTHFMYYLVATGIHQATGILYDLLSNAIETIFL